MSLEKEKLTKDKIENYLFFILSQFDFWFCLRRLV